VELSLLPVKKYRFSFVHHNHILYFLYLCTRDSISFSIHSFLSFSLCSMFSSSSPPFSYSSDELSTVSSSFLNITSSVGNIHLYPLLLLYFCHYLFRHLTYLILCHSSCALLMSFLILFGLFITQLQIYPIKEGVKILYDYVNNNWTNLWYLCYFVINVDRNICSLVILYIYRVICTLFMYVVISYYHYY
jgi:hypothetical protein